MAVPNEELEHVSELLQTDIIGTFHKTYYPLNEDYNQPTITFDVANHMFGTYMDVGNVKMKCEFGIKKGDGSNLDHTETKVGPVNNVFHSYWKDVRVTLNRRTVTDSDSHYAYAAYLHKLLTKSPDMLNTQGRMFGWCKDDYEDMEAKAVKRYAAPTQDADDKAVTFEQRPNPLGVRNGWWFQNEPARGGQAVVDYHTVEFIDKLNVQPFQQEKYLPMGIEMTVELMKNSNDAFAIMDGNQNTASHRLELVKAELIVPYVRLSIPKYLALEEEKLKIDRKMAIIKSKTVVKTIEGGVQHVRINNLFSGKSLPVRLIIGFVDNRAESGNYSFNPFNFGNFGINQLQIFKNQEPKPLTPLTMNFGSKKYMEAYHTVFDSTGTFDVNMGSCISYEEYPAGFTLYGFDLSSDHKADTDTRHISEIGDINFDINFQSQLGTSLSMIVLADYEEEIVFDGTDQVRATWDG